MSGLELVIGNEESFKRNAYKNTEVFSLVVEAIGEHAVSIWQDDEYLDLWKEMFEAADYSLEYLLEDEREYYIELIRNRFYSKVE